MSRFGANIQDIIIGIRGHVKKLKTSMFCGTGEKKKIKKDVDGTPTRRIGTETATPENANSS